MREALLARSETLCINCTDQKATLAIMLILSNLGREKDHLLDGFGRVSHKNDSSKIDQGGLKRAATRRNCINPSIQSTDLVLNSILNKMAFTSIS